MKQKFSSTLIVSVLVVGFVVMFLSSALKGLYQCTSSTWHALWWRACSLGHGRFFVRADHWPGVAGGGLAERPGWALSTVALGSVSAGVLLG